MISHFQRRPRDEGSVLVLALILITVIGSLLFVILSFAGTGLLTGQQANAQRSLTNDVDGAVQAAINSIRNKTVVGTTAYGAACGPFVYPAPGRDTVSVDCSPTSGALGSGDSPQNAILTVGPNPTNCTPQGLGTGDGLCVDGNNQLTVDGNVYSKSNLTVDGSSATRMHVYGEAFAEAGGCPRVTTSGGPPSCPGSDPSGDDPNYVLPTQPAAIDPVATCISNNSVVRFSPGIYTEIPQAPSGCDGEVWWFAPPSTGGLGTYYFDFPAAAGAWKPASLPGKIIIAGQNGALWDASTLDTNSAFTDPAKFRSVCVDSPSDGVQFVLGGPASLDIASGGALAVCAAAPTPGAQRLALYGIRASVAAPPLTTAVADPQTEMTPAVSGDVGFETDATLNTTLARRVDNSSAVATFVNTTNISPDVGSVRLSGFPAVPDGARAGTSPGSLVLDVVHSENVGSDFDVEVRVTVGTTTKTYPVPDCAGSSMCTHEVDVSASVTVEGAQYPQRYPYRDLQKMQITYVAKANLPNTNAGLVSWTAALDGIRARLAYTPAGYRGSTCSGSCALLKSTVNQNLFFRGTVYAPSNFLDLRVHNTDVTIFGRGVVARSLHVDVGASSKQMDAPFQLPKATTGREVIFTGRINGVPHLRARVEYVDFDDSSGSPVAFPGRRVLIKSWVVLRG